MKNYKLYILLITNILFFSLVFSSCGLGGPTTGVFGSKDAGGVSSTLGSTTGVFKGRNRLTSGDPCFDSEDCKQLCASMLKSLSDQEECYDYSEEQVQAFRDTYNLLAFGDPDRLEKITSSEMEEFLDFGTDLWRDAIYGFERGLKKNCVVSGKVDDIDRENCRRSDYYQQAGYNNQGALEALTWIAKNNWLALLISDYDKNLVIMNALSEIAARGINSPTTRTNDVKDCLNGYATDLPMPLVGETFGLSVSSAKNRYIAFASPCLVEEFATGYKYDGRTHSYLVLSAKESNLESFKLGMEFLDSICSSKDDCEKGPFCKEFFCGSNSASDSDCKSDYEKVTQYYYGASNITCS